MGVDLTLLPVDGDVPPDVFFSHTVLPVDRHGDLIDSIRVAADGHASLIPCPLRCYLGSTLNGEHGYGKASSDPYGEPLMYLLVRHFRTIALNYVGGSLPPRNRAVIAYVTALPDDCKVVLYWY